MENNKVVRQQHEFKSKQWGIYVNDVLVEGGFLSKEAAERHAARLLICESCNRVYSMLTGR